MAVHYFAYEDIDRRKWDRCVAEASNGSVYVYASYLDHMSAHWDGLVLGDYEAVMPLTWNRKWGITYLYQPYLSAEGGVFQQEPVTSETLRAFLEAIPGKFRFWEFSLNAENLLPDTGFPLYPRANFLLPLRASYAELSAAYNKNLRRNLKKAEDAGLVYTKDTTLPTVLALAREQLNGHTGLKPIHYARFGQLYEKLSEDRMAVTRGITDERGKLLASGVFLFSHAKAYYLIGGNHPDGRDNGASHLLLDQFIREYAGSGLTFDFEGSDIPSLAQFYRSFGSYEQPYAAIKLNRLPAPLRWLKR
ncbi:GNAT family N-acetyltransferase [Dinghuibacter silviterrae]|uniref:Acetyltransferase (GNAT) family protein n=1 Tax=Dinghuibacter silviterrae TaxID=1539049 RepID=A0A4R8DEQ6_9BACT|nr:GNAT family N-acetyltransferase [Dinghuibacter silviterrae]TDW95877.1 acetyltransferase (GNAT) family protein [Dinghuibacter silviterrae]